MTRNVGRVASRGVSTPAGFDLVGLKIKEAMVERALIAADDEAAWLDSVERRIIYVLTPAQEMAREHERRERIWRKAARAEHDRRHLRCGFPP